MMHFMRPKHVHGQIICVVAELHCTLCRRLGRGMWTRCCKRTWLPANPSSRRARSDVACKNRIGQRCVGLVRQPQFANGQGFPRCPHRGLAHNLKGCAHAQSTNKRHDAEKVGRRWGGDRGGSLLSLATNICVSRGPGNFCQPF